MQGIRLDNIDLPAQEILKVHLERAEVDQRSTGPKLHEEIDVAGGMGLATREGTEDLQAARSVAGRQGKDLLPFRLEEGICDGALAGGHVLYLTLMIPPKLQTRAPGLLAGSPPGSSDAQEAIRAGSAGASSSSQVRDRS